MTVVLLWVLSGENAYHTNDNNRAETNTDYLQRRKTHARRHRGHLITSIVVVIIIIIIIVIVIIIIIVTHLRDVRFPGTFFIPPRHRHGAVLISDFLIQ